MYCLHLRVTDIAHTASVAPGLNLQSPSPNETSISEHFALLYFAQGHTFADGKLDNVGLAEGTSESVGLVDGETEGVNDGAKDKVGGLDGLGEIDGDAVGEALGFIDGFKDGVGLSVGALVGALVGLDVGDSGAAVGEAKRLPQQQLEWYLAQSR